MMPALLQRFAIFRGRTSHSIPFSKDLKTCLILGKNLKASSTNLSDEKSKVAVFGSPKVEQNYVRFRGLQDFFETSHCDERKQTIFVIARSAATLSNRANSPAFFGTYSRNNIGSSLFWNPDARGLQFTAERSVDGHRNSGHPATLRCDIRQWSLYSAVVGDRGNAVNNLSVGKLSENFSNPFGRKESTDLLRIGSLHGGSHAFEGECDIAFFAHYSREMTDTECQAVEFYLRPIMSKLSVGVLKERGAFLDAQAKT